MSSASQQNTGKQIRQRREALGLSVAGLAYLAGISYKTVERIEAGDTEPRRATLRVIEQAFDEYAETGAAA